MSTLRKALEDLLIGGSTARDAAAIAAVSVSYAQDIRRGLVAEGKVPAAPGRGRPRKEKAS